MITNITLENFKCFRKVEVNPKLVTLFIGPNGTGKSGVLQALLLLKQSTNIAKALSLSGPFINLDREAFILRGLGNNSDEVGMSLSGMWQVQDGAAKLPIDFNIQYRFDSYGRFSAEREGHVRFMNRGELQTFMLPDRVMSELASVSRSAALSEYSPPGDSDTDDWREYSELSDYLSVETETGGRRSPKHPPSDALLIELWALPAPLLGKVKAVPSARGLTQQAYVLGSDSCGRHYYY